MKYLALLRGINVGGKTLIKMAELKTCFEQAGFKNVRTYINSGNVFFESSDRATDTLAKEIETCIDKKFALTVRVVVIDQLHYTAMMEAAPAGYGEKEGWKYNVLFLIPPYDINEVIADIGELKPDIEAMTIADGVIFQELLFTSFGKTTGGKLASRASYQKMTIRNWNTARKLRALLEQE